ncbi:uncharacterized protein [Nicotiana tomentosiformis]|uniref:uncharacterized protein n=1 Tax=Nicotiana tomentosiformis TaxID=4098 RepID=UPI00388C3745
MGRDCPRIRMYGLQQGNQAMISAPDAITLAQLARDTPTYMSIPVRDSIRVDCVYHSCLITIRGYVTRADLLFLNMVDFDVILGMDWLYLYHTILDCYAKTVIFSIPGLLRLEQRGSLGNFPNRVDSFLKAQQMVENGCLSYLAFVRDVCADTPTFDSVPVVRRFLDMFLADLPGMLCNMDNDFGIDLAPGTQPISISPYHMAPTELKELL